jgi:hypothetical protein
VLLPPPPPPAPERKPAATSDAITTDPAAPPFDVHGYVAECLDHGSSAADIRRQLIAIGYSTADAAQIVDEAQAWRQKLAQVAYGASDAVAAGKRNMAIGGVVCVIGLVVTIGTLAAASGSGGGSYVIAWGAIVWGAIQFFRGAAQASAGQSE